MKGRPKRGFERRADGTAGETFFALARLDPRFLTFTKAGSFKTEAAARAAARSPGTYRISRVDPGTAGVDLPPFTV